MSNIEIKNRDLMGILTERGRDGFFIRIGCGYDPKACEDMGIQKTDYLYKGKRLCELGVAEGFVKCGKANQR